MAQARPRTSRHICSTPMTHHQELLLRPPELLSSASERLDLAETDTPAPRSRRGSVAARFNRRRGPRSRELLRSCWHVHKGSRQPLPRRRPSSSPAARVPTVTSSRTSSCPRLAPVFKHAHVLLIIELGTNVEHQRIMRSIQASLLSGNYVERA